MVQIYILIEQAIGYGILLSKNSKSTDDLLTKLKERNISKFTSDFELVEFQPFASAANAAFNCVDIANGIVSKDLEKLLTSHLTKGKSILVVNDKRLLESLKGLNLNSELTFSADNSLIFNMREIRHNFHLFLNDSQDHIVKAHIGLGHGYSRIKIKYNVNRSDNMIIQAINLLDQMDKDINTVSMRLREWFGYHYPELFKIVPDYKMYARIVSLIESRAGAVQSNMERIEEILQDSSKSQMIIESAKSSMGYELSSEDFINIKSFADKLILMINERENTAKYLNRKMNQVAPNFSTLVGDIVAARLISHAGSLINLAKFPASTIQILGAEKALFRAIKSRGNTPKYGLIFHSSFIGRAAKGDKGRISRFLAAKISLAVRLDCFMDEPINIYGQHLKKHVEDQLVYLETGKEPQKNYEMMENAVKEAKEFVAELKLKKEAEIENQPTKIEHKFDSLINDENKEKKKKKKVKKEKIENSIKEGKGKIVESIEDKKQEVEEIKVEEAVVKTEDLVEKKKKKRKSKAEEIHMETEVKKEEKAMKESITSEATEKKKKKKSKSIENSVNGVPEPVLVVKNQVAVAMDTEPEKKKKKKKVKVEVKSESTENNEPPAKKKKSSK